MINLVYKRYNRLKYLLRVKHYRGRDIHSPFMYGVMRGALMGSHTSQTEQQPLYRELRIHGFRSKEAGKLTRVYNLLGMNRYIFGSIGYNGQEMVIMPYGASYDSIAEIVSSALVDGEIRCVVVQGIYKTKESRKMWQKLISSHNVVGVDIYRYGLVFVNSNLHQESYKLRV